MDKLLYSKKKKIATISGFVKDKKSGEVLIGASVYIKSPLTGVNTNAFGFFSLSLPENKYELYATFFSKETMVGALDLHKDTSLTILLSQEIELNEVEVKAGNSPDKIKDALVYDKLNVENIKKIPQPFGEPDVLRMIQMMPGVQSNGEATLGYYVRGGSFAQNLVLLDDAPVYNATHLMGIVSAFNPDMIKSVDFYKGGIPSGYQSGASSVMDVRAKDGNNKSFHINGGVGLISSKLAFEGPIKKEKGSFFIAARKSVLPDVYLKSSFYDINLKANYILNKNNRIYLSGYEGDDKFGYKSGNTAWKNRTLTLRYNHIFGGKLFSNASLIYSKFSIRNGVRFEDINQISATQQAIDNRIAKYVLSWFPLTGLTVQSGVYYNAQNYSPFSLNFKDEQLDTTLYFTFKRNARETSAFVDLQHRVGKHFNYQFGLRATRFEDNTNDSILFFNPISGYPDSIKIKPSLFKVLEPRMSINYVVNDNQSIKASYNHINQFQQQFQGGSLFNLAQIWLPSSSILKPQAVDQFALGYFLKKKSILYSIETFYKRIHHVSDFKNGSQLVSSSISNVVLINIESQLKEGSAEAYGLETAITKTEGRFTGWMNYTFSNTMYTIPEINASKPYPANFNNLHSVSMGGLYELNKKWEFSITFQYKSGRAFSFPDSFYQLNGKYYAILSERNKERTPAFHRLDFSVIYKPVSKNKKFSSLWVFTLLNVYNHFNASYYTIEGKDVTAYALFPIFPSLSYNFNF